jgi:hypothetical protein
MALRERKGGACKLQTHKFQVRARRDANRDVLADNRRERGL